MNNLYLDAALHYAHDLHLSVIPLHERSKKPVFLEWQNIATTDESMITKWWTQQPLCNVGIATGRKSDMFVLDVDPKNGGDESYETLIARHGQFDDTWTQITGSGGKHLFFRMPAFDIGNKVGIMPGIDIRGTGGQIVAPPSIHPDTGKRYMWDGLREPGEAGAPLAEAPGWLLDMLLPKVAPGGVKSVEPQIRHGQQHMALVSLAGQLRRMGLTGDEIFPSLWAVNVSRCERPGPESNIREIAHSMMRYQPGDRSLAKVANTLWREAHFAEEKAKEHKERTASIDGYTLLTKEIEGPREVVQGMLHNGLTVFAGRPKSGKSYLTLQIAISVASGCALMGNSPVLRPGRVCYYALEDSMARTAIRMKQLAKKRDITMQNIEFYYEIRPFKTGGREDFLREFDKMKPSLVIIDTYLALCQGNTGKRGDIMQEDYTQIAALRKIATDNDTAMLLVHHTRKDIAGSDPFDAIAGTTGITAATDCNWVIQRQPERKSLLSIKGREIEEQDFLIKLNIDSAGGWELLQTGDDVAHSEQQSVMLEILGEIGRADPKTLAREMGRPSGTIRMALSRALARGLVVKEGEQYRVIK